MKSLRSIFLGLVFVALLFVCFKGMASAGVLFSDDFPGTSLNIAKWGTAVQAGPAGQFTVDNGLNYLGSTGNDWTSIYSYQTFSSNVDAVMTFSNYQSTTTYPSGYTGKPSSAVLSLGPPANNVDVMLANSHFVALGFNALTDTWWSVTSSYTTATSGQLMLSYVGSNVEAYYNVGSGWQFLASFSPGWTAPVDVAISGANMPNGSSSFTVNSISVSSVPLPSALLLFGPGLIGLAAVRRKFKSLSVINLL